ncbi:putative inositol polyphosphate 5-phosphatase C9G1.10c [Beauveria bassiana]|nr:putative inositol polyphosphate 5-phosphatase C9G1.10c [Beauveria bassiana]
MPSKTVMTRDMAPPSRPPLSTQQFLPPPSRNRSKTLESKNSDKGDFSTSVSPEPKGPAEESALPDIACINRKAPYLKESCISIEAGYEPKLFDVCGDVVCATGSFTRGWNTLDGGKLFSLIHKEGVKATAIIFKPNLDPDAEDDQIWIGMNSGDMMEVDVATGRILCTKPGAHGRYEIKKAYRYRNQIWTLDESGCLHIWGPDVDGTPNLNKNPTHTHRVPTGHTCSLVADGQLWHVAGKAIRVFDPWSAAFQVLVKPLVTEGTADITAGTTMDAHPRKVFFGHVDGKVSIYCTRDYTCQKVIHVSQCSINTLAAVSADLWVGYSTGVVSIYDTKKSPWVTKKEWQAHNNGIHQLKADAAAPYRIERAQVVSVGNDGMVKLWDGFLQEDRLEASLESNQTKFCQFDELSLMVMTWNAGASTPHSLRYSNGDSSFFQEFVQTSGSPDILVFGFQELVDLEDKTATAKRFLKSKKTDTDNMGHHYRDWQEFLRKTLDDYAPEKPLYQELSTECLVGLFTCIFVKSSLLGRIKMADLQSAMVKRGMGGLHGNKGAIAVRFHIDDSSLCFVNCHLAAGQTATKSRHEDITHILKAELFRKQLDESKRQNYYRGGGDGDLIVDHEICVINGDLNYRIDTMSHETVVRAVKQNKLSRLLDRDQLLVARRRTPAFQLRAFEELPLTFAPTYKYDVGTDRYDTSEKRRSPAWCDRLLYRGNGKIEQLDYGRHEVKVSDHRPVSGNFRVHVKKVDGGKREQVKMEAHKTLEAMRQNYLDEAKLNYLVVTCGLSESESREHIQDRLARNSR